MSNIKKNIVLQTVYEVFALIIPFITAPYVSRVLGSTNVGIYSYNYSIINYFMIFMLLGLDSYGNRAIAKVRNDKNKINQVFSEIFIAHLLISIIVIAIYIFYCCTLTGQKQTIAMIQSLYLIGQMLNISWLYKGMEEFRWVILRNMAIKLIVLMLVFGFVREKDDLLIYIFILALDMFLSQSSLWIIRHKYAKFVRVNIKGVIQHIKPMTILFVAIIASSIYCMMDKTMLGAYGKLSELGCYEYADKIIRMPLAVITGVGTVMLSRTANMFGNGKKKEAFSTTKIMLKYITAFSSLMIFGFLSYGTEFAVLYLGRDYAYTGELLKVLAITLLFMSWNNVLRTQYYIPQEKDSTYVLATGMGAFLNIILNVVLIPKMDSLGAAIATVFSYMLVMMVQLYFARVDLNGVKLLMINSPFFMLGFLPFLFSYFWKKIFPDNWLGLIIQIIIFSVEFSIIGILYLWKSCVLAKKK